VSHAQPVPAIDPLTVELVARARAARGRGEDEFRCALAYRPEGHREALAAVSGEGWFLATSSRLTGGARTNDEPVTVYVFRRR
jgi:hypothetical protein